jgi:hypothetical protein
MVTTESLTWNPRFFPINLYTLNAVLNVADNFENCLTKPLTLCVLKMLKFGVRLMTDL